MKTCVVPICGRSWTVVTDVDASDAADLKLLMMSVTLPLRPTDSDVFADFSKGITDSIYWGICMPYLNIILVRKGAPKDVLAHEIGHAFGHMTNNDMTEAFACCFAETFSILTTYFKES